MTKKILCLGIESTAHTFGIGIANEAGEILADVKSVYKPPERSGIHPRDAAQHHARVAAQILEDCLEKASVDIKDISSIAFSLGPGLGPVLRVGATIARTLSLFLNKPLIPVHHAVGHIEIAALTTNVVDPLTVIVSGGHTSITAFSEKHWRIFGETQDITLGNLFDILVRKIGYSSPGGAKIEELAKKGKHYIDLPYSVKGNDVAYSGLLTASIKKLNEGFKIEDICYSIQEIAFSMLAEATERSLCHLEKKELMLTGGVAVNRRLQEMFRNIAEEHGVLFTSVEKKYSADCGAQIAWAGILGFKTGENIRIKKSYVKPRWRLDHVKILWRKHGLCV